jgi:S1-C subfamily serine protease
MWLTVRSGDKRGTAVRIDGDRFLVGRDEACDLVLPDAKVSRQHAALEPERDGAVRLRDLGSRNGTFVNGQRVETAPLRGQEQIQLGDTVLASSLEQPAGASTVFGSPTLGAILRPQSESAVHRLLVARSARRATILGAAAIAVAVAAGAVVAASLVWWDTNGADAAVQAVVDDVAPATVVVESRHGNELVESGSGWVLDAREGLIVTNAHVLNGGTAFRVGRGGTTRLDAQVVGVAPCEDLAVLRVGNTLGLRSLPLGAQSTLELGETVVALGYPANASEEASLTSTSGVVSVVSTAYREPAVDVPRYPNVIQTDAAINPGSSGGPLVDLNGMLVGVNSAGRTLAADGRIVQGQGYAIGVDRVRKITAVLRTGRSIAWSGLSFDFSPQPDRGRTGARDGLLAGPVVPGTSAARAGLGKRRGALILAVNGMPLDTSLASYCDAVAGLRSGDAVTLTLAGPGGAAPRTVAVALE